MLSPSQLKRYWLELRAVESSLSAPSASPREKFDRSAFHSLHNLPPSTKNFTQKDFDTFLAACRAITQPANLQPQLRAFDQPKTRLLNKILIEQAAQLRALDIINPSEYIAQICADKFHGRRPSDLSGPSALSASPRENYSDLEKLLFTIARAIVELRQKSGWTVHELLWHSNLLHTCVCADCHRAKVGRVAPRAPSPELATAASAEPHPF